MKSVITGEGVEPEPSISNLVMEIKGINLEEKKFVLYLGRRDVTKNTDLLAKAYRYFKRQYPNSKLELVLAGPGISNFSETTVGLNDFGFVSENEKASLLALCCALFQPSQNESFSRVIMEAWLNEKPVVVHKGCLATASAVKSANGGFLAETEEEWARIFFKVDISKDLKKYGQNGYQYAKEYADWDKVIDRYEEVLFRKEQIVIKLKSNHRIKAIHQLLPNLSYGDAISNHAIAIRDQLLRMGYESKLFVRYLDERMKTEGKVFEPRLIEKHSAILYHHSIGSELTQFAITHSGPKCFIYHNITPAYFFEKYRPHFAKILEKGRSDIKNLVGYFSLAAADSSYNANELKDFGISAVEVLPIAVSPAGWNSSPDERLMNTLQDGIRNILFVGRIAPNKRQDDLIKGFNEYLKLDPKARLIIVGDKDDGDPYYLYLQNLIQKLHLDQQIFFTGLVTDAQLQAYYRTAHLFWSMSEHEGFCIPLIEAMWFDIPVLAFKSSAVGETLGEGGIIFNSKTDLLKVAALAKILICNDKLKSTVLYAQQKRRNYFLPEKVWPKLEKIIAKMEILLQ